MCNCLLIIKQILFNNVRYQLPTKKLTRILCNFHLYFIQSCDFTQLYIKAEMVMNYTASIRQRKEILTSILHYTDKWFTHNIRYNSSSIQRVVPTDSETVIPVGILHTYTVAETTVTANTHSPTWKFYLVLSIFMIHYHWAKGSV